MKKGARILWLDVETTGLDENNGLLLEVAAIVTDVEGFDLASYSSIIGYPDKDWANDVVSLMEPVVINMHTKSGLLLECADCHKGLYEVETELLKTLVPHGSEFVRGGSNPDFDHRWVKKHMPRVAGLMTHQQLEMNTIRHATNPTWQARPHRAFEDIKMDLELFVKFRARWKAAGGK